MGKRLQIPEHAVELNCEPVAVRWGDMDAFGHVNSIIYYQYFEQARATWLRGCSPPEVMAGESNTGPVIASSRCDYLQPIIFPCNLSIRYYGSDCGSRSYQSWYRVEDADRPEILYALGHAAIVWVNYEAGNAVSVPANIKAMMNGTNK